MKLVWLCLLFWIILAANTLTEPEWVNVARCRVNCLEKFTSYPPSDSARSNNTDCNMCWTMCETLRTSSWGLMCDPKRAILCTLSCRMACNFTNNVPARYRARDHEDWHLDGPPKLETVSNNLTFTWESAKSEKNRKPVFLVYALFWRADDIINWSHIMTTADTGAKVTFFQHPRGKGLRFKVVAVSEGGMVAQTEPISPPNMLRNGALPGKSKDDGILPPFAYEYEYEEYAEYEDYEEELKEEEKEKGDKLSKQSTIPTSTTTSIPKPTTEVATTPPNLAEMAVGIRVDESQGRLRAIIFWPQVTYPDVVTYEVQWGVETCGVDSNWPGCDDVRMLKSNTATIQAFDSQDMSFILPDLIFNSKYWMTISLDSVSEKKIYFETPGCPNPDESLSICDIENPTEKIQDVAPDMVSNVAVYTIMAACIAVGVIVVVTMVIVLRKHKQLRDVITTRMGELRTRTNSFRSSISKASFKRSSYKKNNIEKEDGALQPVEQTSLLSPDTISSKDTTANIEPSAPPGGEVHEQMATNGTVPIADTANMSLSSDTTSSLADVNATMNGSTLSVDQEQVSQHSRAVYRQGSTRIKLENVHCKAGDSSDV